MNLEHASQPEDREGSEHERLENLHAAFQKTRESINAEIADAVFPEGVRATSMKIDFFQSPTFKKAGYSYMPERYGTFDRSLTTVTLEDDTQVFIVNGKVSGDNPWEVFHATAGGTDLRGSEVVVYAYDGDETITEFAHGQENAYSGEYGVPDALLPAIMESMGEYVRSESL
jgi:hypothetical protein